MKLKYKVKKRFKINIRRIQCISNRKELTEYKKYSVMKISEYEYEEING